MSRKKRIRRTREEIARGVTLNDKKSIPSLEPNVASIEKQDIAPSSSYATREEARSNTIEPYIGDKKLSVFLDEEFGKGAWEWKEITIDDDFRLEVLEKAGKEGWKFAFVFDKVNTIPGAKFNSILMHRLIRRR